MIMRGTPGAPYSMGNVSANYPTVWFGGPVSQVHTGPRVRTRPRRLRGLGDCMSYSDILAAIGGPNTNCDPHDSTCVMVGAQKANAAEDAMISSSCIPAGTPISFVPDTSTAALNAFMGNNPIAQPITVGGTTVTEIAGGGVSTNPKPPAPPAQVVNPSPATQSTSTGTSATSSGSAVSQANGGTAGSSGNVNSTTTEWISGVPDWLVVVGGGLLAFLILSRR